MRILFATLLVLVSQNAFSQVLIPVRPPNVGEPRPSWWLSIWMDQVVVVEGKVHWNENRKPEIRLVSDPDAMTEALGPEQADVAGAMSGLRIGVVKPKRFLFASPGIAAGNGIIRDLENGKMTEFKCLIPVMTVNGQEFMFNLANKKEGVFIFNQNAMTPFIPMLFKESIPKEGMRSATAVFRHRNQFDHTKLKKP